METQQLKYNEGINYNPAPFPIHLPISYLYRHFLSDSHSFFWIITVIK